LQHELANKIVNTPPVIEGASEGPLEEVTLESEIDRVTKIIEDAGLFEASSEPESVTLMKIDVEYARQSIVDSDPTKQIRSMGLLARWS
jgi:hypothetical protein